MITTNFDADLQTVKDVLKKAWKTGDEIEAIVTQIEDKPELLEKIFNENFKPTVLWIFGFKYPKNATEEEKQKLFFEEIEKHQTKQSLADSKKKANS